MLGHTHALIGVTAVATLQALTAFIHPHPIDGLPVGPALCLGAAVIGALLPDIDAEESSVKAELGFAGRMLGGLLRLAGVKHRGATHFGLTALLMLALGLVIGQQLGYPDVGLAFGLGYLSHLLADALTKTGLPLLWPWRRQVHLLPRPLRVRTGGGVESLLFMITAAVFILLLPGLIPPAVLKLLASLGVS
jgi:inner membrane protein